MGICNCIVTDRLIIRPFVEGDEYDLLQILKDDYSAQMAGFKPYTTLSSVSDFMKRWRRGAFAITRRCSDTVIGIIEAPISFEGIGVLGYCLAEEYRGNGYMAEAVEAMKIYMFDHHWADEINIYVYCGNDASRNVALKCGFFPKYSSYKEMIYSPHGDVQSEECFCITKEDYEWEKSGRDFFTT